VGRARESGARWADCDLRRRGQSRGPAREPSSQQPAHAYRATRRQPGGRRAGISGARAELGRHL